jgi:four helix bundle protein
MGQESGVVSYRDLKVWQAAHRLVLMVYQVTSSFPDAERFGLISQMRRAAVSVPANVVEGFKRRSPQDKLRFYNVAEASLEELKYFILLVTDLGFTTVPPALHDQAKTVSRLLYCFTQSVQQNYQRDTHRP